MRYLFIRTLIVEGTHRGFSICSETLKIRSENATPSLLDQAKRRLESFRNDIAFYFPQVRSNTTRLLRSFAMKFKEHKFRVPVKDCSLLDMSASAPVSYTSCLLRELITVDRMRNFLVTLSVGFS